MNDSGSRTSPTSPVISEASSYPFAPTDASNATPVGPYAVSKFERTAYYHGISPDTPELLYRSDLFDHPFPIPKDGFAHLPTKTTHGVFNPPINVVEDTVAPQIVQCVKARNIRCSSFSTAPLVTHGEEGDSTSGPIVIWFVSLPNTTTAENVHDASPDTLALLEAHGVKRAVVEWNEGVVQRMWGSLAARGRTEARAGAPISMVEKDF
ncbi:hypothetical protein FA95DRAFT_1683535 [Auriscalpium vulgare]|uniref:Uncharacterized protein n=1 Tax=Auriscalpium vulgare TaxID=40419 RepID=A0ACB8RAN4_9AGAM|nr:hypothetical protein FA95DRAFT_1683535 [Auriscalpium vulgare]